MSISGFSLYSLYEQDSPPLTPPSTPPAGYPSRAIHRKRSAYRTLPNPPSSPRPLPSVPRMLSCKTCKAYITNPLLLCKSTQRSFRGFSGKAALFNEIYNAHLSPPQVQLMVTGAHTMQLISCSTCDAYLGYKIVRAHESSETWKEGRCLLELESLCDVGYDYSSSSSSSSSEGSP